MQKRTDGTTAVAEPFPIPTEQNGGIVAPQKIQPGQQDAENPFMQQEIQEPLPSKWTRHLTMSNNSERIPSTSTAVIQQQELHELQISDHLIQTDSQIPPPSANTIDRQPDAQTGYSSHPITPEVVTSAAVQGNTRKTVDSG